MGYAIFANRKIMLTSRLNSLQQELVQIEEQKQRLLDYSANIADGEITVDEVCSDISNLGRYNDVTERWNNQESHTYKKQADGSYAWVDGPWKSIIADNIAAAEAEYRDKNEYATDDEVAAQMEQTENNIRKSLRQDYVQNIEQKKLNALENQLDMKMKRIETKITATQNDLQSCEQAETKAIQNATPKYAGLG